MSDTLPGLVVLAIGGSIASPLLLLTILFLGTRQPLPNAGALALGYFTTCAVIGISGLLLFGGARALSTRLAVSSARRSELCSSSWASLYNRGVRPCKMRVELGFGAGRKLKG
jgi:hypothetical protein